MASWQNFTRAQKLLGKKFKSAEKHLPERVTNFCNTVTNIKNRGGSGEVRKGLPKTACSHKNFGIKATKQTDRYMRVRRKLLL